ncbi:MAG: hypothetical protein AAGA30_13055, partial [Planctomycetota bacterium]
LRTPLKLSADREYSNHPEIEKECSSEEIEIVYVKNMKHPSHRIRSIIALLICGFGLFFLFRIIAGVSPQFEQGTVGKVRPLLETINYFWLSFFVYLLSVFVVWKSCVKNWIVGSKSWILVSLVFAFAIVFRFAMVSSVPIQEIDLYRYIWDGAVVSEGLDPYQFGPQSVFDAYKIPELQTPREGLDQYTDIIRQRPGLERVLEITHFGSYTSPYPPVSQFFFGLATSRVPRTANARQYVVAIKWMLTSFDLLTGIVVALLLHHLGRHPALAVIYLWCPLVIKEIANGGHLDSIATFFCTLAIYFLVIGLWRRRRFVDDKSKPIEHDGLPKFAAISLSLSSIALAAGVAAKVFPIFCLPLWFVATWRGGLQSLISWLIFPVALFMFAQPMLPHLDMARKYGLVNEQQLAAAAEADPSGIEAFSAYWEMNDLIFMLIVENLKPTPNQETNPQKTPWFRVTTNQFREQAIHRIQPWFENPDSEVQHLPQHYAFFFTRALTLGTFVLIVVWSCLVFVSRPDANKLLELLFLTLAWFWILSPTQNPWYWTWALPLLVFARNPAWYLMSGTLMAYYYRFWFEYHFSGIDVIGYYKTKHGDVWWLNWLFPASDFFRYQSTTFFDFYIPFLEFAPILFLLALGFWLRPFYERTNRVEHAQD